MTLPKHVPALDGLRGVAILMVVLTHCGDGFTRALAIHQDSADIGSGFALPNWLVSVGASAVNGVPLFFIVSAFTLTLRADGGHQDWRAYALRRIARVGPAYWIAGFFYLCVSGLGPVFFAPAGVSVTDILVAAAFGTVWHGGPSFAVVPGGWSVSAEVAFYVALPFLVMAIDGRIWRAALLTGSAYVAAQVQARHAVATNSYDFAVYASPLQQAPVFLCGIAAAIAVTRMQFSRMPGLVIVSLAVCIVIIPALTGGSTPEMAFALCATLAVASAAAYPPRWLTHPAIVRIGKLSYSIYLVHFAMLLLSIRIARWIVPSMDWRTLCLHFALVLASSAGIASLTWRFIEQPPIRWAARVSRRLPSPASVAAVR